MTEQSEFEINVFEDFIGLYVSPFCQSPTEGYTLEDMRHSFNAGMQACAERKDKELAALRDFSQLVVESGDFLFIKLAKSLNLIDESGNPTPLLTGESE